VAFKLRRLTETQIGWVRDATKIFRRELSLNLKGPRFPNRQGQGQSASPARCLRRPTCKFWSNAGCMVLRNSWAVSWDLAGSAPGTTAASATLNIECCSLMKLTMSRCGSLTIRCSVRSLCLGNMGCSQSSKMTKDRWKAFFRCRNFLFIEFFCREGVEGLFLREPQRRFQVLIARLDW
jgi:hypothetical protein